MRDSTVMNADPALVIEGLRKEYRRRNATTVAIDGLDLVVEQGSVFGFLGPNGSGKTTTIRCMLGLVRPTAGSVRVFGATVPKDLPRVRHRIGALVETPKLFPSFSASDNLDLLARLKGVPTDQISGALDIVGLTDRANDPVASFSLGMRQRLAVAAALLGEPDLLVLDEPANGLDPAGIAEMRALIRRLGDTGRTVFVSSHQLGDVERMCDRVGIVRGGRLVALHDVRSLTDESAGFRVRVEATTSAAAVLTDAGWTVDATGDANTINVRGPNTGRQVSEALAKYGLFVDELTPVATSLEELFLRLTDPINEQATPSDRATP